VYSTIDPVILPIGGGTNAFTLDFCLTSAGIETACLADIAYGRLKVVDTLSGTKIFLALEMVSGKLDSNSDYMHEYTEGISSTELEILDTLITENVFDISEADPTEVDGLYVTETDQNGIAAFEVKIISV
jgi:hypothetical protein